MLCVNRTDLSVVGRELVAMHMHSMMQANQLPTAGTWCKLSLILSPQSGIREYLRLLLPHEACSRYSKKASDNVNTIIRLQESSSSSLSSQQTHHCK